MCNYRLYASKKSIMTRGPKQLPFTIPPLIYNTLMVLFSLDDFNLFDHIYNLFNP